MDLLKMVAIQGHYGQTLAAKQPPYMPELELASAKVLIDERVLLAIERRRPVGLSRTAWVNYLLQYALTSHPEIIDVRGIDA
ncbi:MAG: hypothetical protein EBY40_05575 [Marivivens sp.]|nr:hypothetical protein [Marivivens sp.]NDH02585.1 hypothetical protein [Marivivens sp.]